jgi:outer membrane protein OmpA-like peptidoglycan-associated protein
MRAGFMILIAMLACQVSISAQDLGKLKKQAEVYFKNKAYKKALYYYTQYANRKALDRDSRFNMAVSSYESNNLSQAQKIFSNLTKEKNFDTDAYLYLGKLAHVNNDYDAAQQLYKKYLALTKDSENAKLEARNLIRSCNVGQRLLLLPEQALVENLGRGVNTTYDDFGAIQSPNYSDKIYFSSARKSASGGLRNDAGQRDNEYGKYNSDLFSSKKDGGSWTTATPMGGQLNSQQKDVILGFSQSGDVSYLFRGSRYDEGSLLVDTFNANQEEAVAPSVFDTPIKMDMGDSRPYFYNDSLVLFSSFRKGGYGGYDLYAMVKSTDGWSVPFNLGPQINSAFDEQYPYLAKDGRSLYFSSNDCRASIGGFDIFEAHYNQDTKMWGNAKNMGLPINSAGDDTHFQLTADGSKAYLTSDRKTGLGERDIFIAYFKQVRADQVQASYPITFIQLEDQERRLAISEQIISGSTSSVGTSFEEEERVDIPQQVNIESIFYTSDRDLLSEANKRKIDVVSELMKLDNTLTVRVECHTSVTGPLPFDMYFSVKRAEKIAEALVAEGIPARKIQIEGFGPLYPIALNEINGVENEVGKQLNNRVEFKIQGKGELDIKVDYILPIVSKFQADPRGSNLAVSQKGLVYKINIANTTQMFDDEVLDLLPDPKVGKVMTENMYTYSVGNFRTFQTAIEFRKELIKFDLLDTKIQPYIDGEQMKKNKSFLYLEKYPDLKYYFEAE